ncbi:tetratricopeptide repeat protein [Candidatus Woesearchaeota archaeon]|nr:tetratricopeptide repeat protein [Candidatus Woesearchaeota archaeon]
MKKISKNLIAVFLIIFLSITAYGNIFINDFVWDDYMFILENTEIKSFSNVLGFFTSSIDGLYRPLRSISYAVVYSVFKDNPFGYHLYALFLHIMISILAYFIILKIINKRNIALIASLLFALHPVHTGRVTNMTAGFDLLGIFLYLLAFYFYVWFSKCRKSEISEHAQKSKRFFTNKKLNYLILSVIIFFIGLLASEEVITLPLIIILYEFSFNKERFSKDNFKSLFKRYSPFFIIAGIYVFFRFFVLGMYGRVPEYASQGWYFTGITMTKVFIGYILLLIFPFDLKLFHDVAIANSIFDVLLPILILIFIVFITIRLFNKITFFCVFWFFITLLPVSNIVPLVVLMAERYLYLPSLGFCLLLAFAFDKIYNLDIKKNIRIGLVVFIVLLFLSYSFAVVKRNAEWKDNLTLWTETVKDSPNNSGAHDNLGFTYERMGRYKEAITEFSKAIELKPDNYKAHTNLGVALAKVGLYNYSIIEFETALTFNQYYKTYNKLGLVYAETGEYEKAILMLNKTVVLKPKYAKGYNDLGTIYGQVGSFDASLEAFKTAIILDKDYADAHYNLGVLYDFLGERGKALEELRKSVSLEPDNELYRKKLSGVE